MVKLRSKQIRFCEEYLIDLNATQAAIRAGYSKHTAYAIGHENLRKPEIKAFIDAKMNENGLSSAETVKLLADIAKSNLNQYFTLKQVEYSQKKEVTLKEYIKVKEAEIAFEEEFAQVAKLSGDALALHEQSQQMKRIEVIRLKLELKHNPKATRIIYEPAKLIERAELDLVALVKDKERGRIKSISFTEFGPKVELYGADAALRDFAKIHGLFEKDNQQKQPGIGLTVSEDQYNQLLKEARENSFKADTSE